jgi:hypothetical protein
MGGHPTREREIFLPYLFLMNPHLSEPSRNAKNGQFVPVNHEEAMSREAYPGGWHIYKKSGCPFKPWKAENTLGPKRVRIGFATEEDAVAHVMGIYNLSRSERRPLLDLSPDAHELWAILETLAPKLVNGSAEEIAFYNSIVRLDDRTRRTIHMMIPRIINCGDRHKPENITKALFDKLVSTRSNFTVQQMVDARLSQKTTKNNQLKCERERGRTKGHFDQVIEVGESLIAFFKPDTDIDSISRADMELWEIDYLKNHLKSDGSRIAVSTMEGRKGIAASYFIEAQNQGWPGTPPCKQVTVGNDKETVILNFHEVSGVLIALRYLNPRACLAFAIELYGLLRAGESLWVKRNDICLPGQYLKVEVPKLDSNHANRNRSKKRHTIQIIDALYQWICYLNDSFGDYVWPEVMEVKDEGKAAFRDVVLEARNIAQCVRWNHKDNGRHTGASMADALGVLLPGIQTQMRHKLGSLTTQDSYLRDMDDRDAAAILLITPSNLGWVPKPYPYSVPKGSPDHLGHRLCLTDERVDNRSVMDEYIPKLRARDAAIRAALKLK